MFEKRQNNHSDKYKPDFIFTIGLPVLEKHHEYLQKD